LTLESRRFKKTSDLVQKLTTKDSFILNASSGDAKMFEKPPSENIININIQKNNAPNFVLDDVQELPFKDNAFDICVLTEVWPFIYESEKMNDRRLKAVVSLHSSKPVF